MDEKTKKDVQGMLSQYNFKTSEDREDIEVSIITLLNRKTEELYTEHLDRLTTILMCNQSDYNKAIEITKYHNELEARLKVLEEPKLSLRETYDQSLKRQIGEIEQITKHWK